MNQIFKSSLCLAVLFSTIAAAKVVPYISIRSQSENAARELVLWQTQINLYDMCNWYGSFSITPEYTRTFKSEKIARALFCDAIDNDCCDTKCVSFKVQGSQVTGRAGNAFLAENFGLPTDYSSVVTIEPRIENFLADFNLYLGLDEWCEGMYFRIHAPVVYSRWDLGFCERDVVAGTRNYEIGYFNNTVIGTGDAATPYYGVARSNLVSTFEDFVGNEAVPTIANITFNKLEHAKMSKCRRHETKLSDIQAALGWNFWMDEDYHVGLNIRGAAPTGSRVDGRYLFEPIVGNGRHWELGGGLTSHWTVWRNCDETDDFTIYLDANITHMFKAHQCRTFDLCNKPLSRYMLAEKMKTPAVNIANLADDATRVAPAYQFDNEYTSVANLSTIPVDVSAAVQGEIALKFAYSHCNWQFDLGYDFWGRSCEKICPRCNDCCTTDAAVTTWALKGDAFVYAFTSGYPDTAGATSVALSAAETDATIFCGTNGAVRTDPTYVWEQNPGVDNAHLAFTAPAGVDGVNLVNVAGGIGHVALNVFSSFDPVVFSSNETKQWDIQAARSKGISHKVFGNFGYTWKDHECWVPYLGIGAEAEFGQVDKKCCCCNESTAACVQKLPTDAVTSSFDCGNCSSSCCSRSSSDNCCNDNCNSDCNDKCCTSVAVSQWGVWVKGGISFN